MYFTQGLHRALQQHPNRLALKCDDRQHTFCELADRVSRFASGLGGVVEAEAGTPRIAILSLNSDYYLEAYLAIAWMGAIAVPVNTRWSTAEIAFSLDDCGAETLLVDDTFAEMGAGLLKQCSALKALVHLGQSNDVGPARGGDRLISTSTPMADTRTSDDALFGIFYTGGTTGRSKGVMLSHRNIISTGLATLGSGAFGEDSIGLHAAPMFHLADMVMFSSLILRGGTHVVLPAFDPSKMIDMMATNKVTDTLVVPAMLAALVNNSAIESADLGALSYILYGASPAPEPLLNLTQKKLPHVNLMQGYGMTESSGVIAFLAPEAHRDVNNRQRLRAAGRAALDVEIRIVDENGSPVDVEEVGEIAFRGPNVMQGYLNMKEATEEVLKGGWMRTGDLGYLDEGGYVFIVDRAKDMIISGGENVYSTEVENTVAKHPAVMGVAVIGIPDDSMGEKVHASVVLKPSESLTLEDLQAFCRDHLGGYKIPRSLDVIDAMPMSGAGKILKTKLRKPYWDGQARSIR